jgi:hypothetical protein
VVQIAEVVLEAMTPEFGILDEARCSRCSVGILRSKCQMDSKGDEAENSSQRGAGQKALPTRTDLTCVAQWHRIRLTNRSTFKSHLPTYLSM